VPPSAASGSNHGVTPGLVGAPTYVAAVVELHATRVEDGVVRMRPLEGGIAIAAGGMVELRPGGLHLMLMGQTRDLNPGDRFDVLLRFDVAGSVRQLPFRESANITLRVSAGFSRAALRAAASGARHLGSTPGTVPR
jgi:hypothetical protein